MTDKHWSVLELWQKWSLVEIHWDTFDGHTGGLAETLEWGWALGRVTRDGTQCPHNAGMDR